jgi:hypothetical protein
MAPIDSRVDGSIGMVTEPLDLESLLGELR